MHAENRNQSILLHTQGFSVCGLVRGNLIKLRFNTEYVPCECNINYSNLLDFDSRTLRHGSKISKIWNKHETVAKCPKAAEPEAFQSLGAGQKCNLAPSRQH